LQGDAPLPRLVEQFREEGSTCLFGSLSLWQGVDVPGSACQLVVIDKLPFPRPDDPLPAARKAAADARGDNGFTAVYATQAASLLAQGVGRLIRADADRGVVAVLDPRLHSKSYGRAMLRELPPLRRLRELDMVLAALRRIDEG
jgi:ATP-dependent DNA helicase DinG